MVLGIAGCSGSGKTTLAAELAHALGGIHFHLDNYYRDLGHMPYSERILQNFDDPAMIESPLLAAHVAALVVPRIHGPAQEQIGRGLHDALADHHALALVDVDAGPRIGRQHRLLNAHPRPGAHGIRHGWSVPGGGRAFCSLLP